MPKYNRYEINCQRKKGRWHTGKGSITNLLNLNDEQKKIPSNGNNNELGNSLTSDKNFSSVTLHCINISIIEPWASNGDVKIIIIKLVAIQQFTC